jgi:hypothetical protein
MFMYVYIYIYIYISYQCRDNIFLINAGQMQGQPATKGKLTSAMRSQKGYNFFCKTPLTLGGLKHTTSR